MSSSQPQVKIDPKTLREIAVIPRDFEILIATGERDLERKSVTAKEQVRLLTDLGYYYRIVGKLDAAEKSLQQALKINTELGLGIASEIQIQLRLANVMQWQKRYDEAAINFEIILELCRRFKEAAVYLDFSYQHAGKNLFEQSKYKEALKYFTEALRLRQERKASADLIDSTQFAIKATRQHLG